MTTETMTIHRALVEIKTIDSRISKAIDGAEFVTYAKHGAKKVGAVAVDDFIKNAQSTYDSVMDLINRRNAIRAAVSNSNAITKITVDGKEYTVAEALALKQYGMLYYSALLGQIKLQYGNVTAKINSANTRIDSMADDFVKTLYGGESKTKDADPDVVAKARATYIEQNSIDLIDGLSNTADIIKNLQDYIDSFNNEIDAALSVSNAVTEITISY